VPRPLGYYVATILLTIAIACVVIALLGERHALLAHLQFFTKFCLMAQVIVILVFPAWYL